MTARNEENFQKYVNWITAPDEYRNPKTKRELARQLGCTRQTFYQWDKQMRDATSEDNIATLLGRARANALRANSSYNDILAYARLMGVFDKSEQRGINEPTGDDYLRIRNAARDRLSETNRRDNGG